MILWIDAQLSPKLAAWLGDQFGVRAEPIGSLGYLRASDVEIFEAARKAGAVIMTKDADFRRLLHDRGAPPSVIWITVGNSSTAHLKEMLARTFPSAVELLEGGEALVEIRDRP